MKLTRDVLVASRYQLVECLGAGAMGEVWRAQDTRFESRTVAVKFLREDETLKEDALNRDRLVIRVEQQAARGSLTVQSALEAIAAALGASNLEGLRAKAEATLGSSGAFKPADVVTVFDELVNDPTFNDNARMRAKLRRLFRDEANAVANLRHDNVVSIFDYGDHEGSPYLVMDYIEGRTVYQVIQANELLQRSRKLLLIEDLCAGLGYAHKHKLVHRDIKPANLIIDGSTGSLKILDFGVVRRLGSASTVGVPVGTFCYMSPEQTKGAATLDHRSDIFAVGLVFYELLSGKKAFPPGKSIGDLVARIQRDPPPPLVDLVPSIPKSIEEIINKAIQKLPENRYQDLSLMEREVGKVRAKIEAAEQSEGTSITLVGDATIVRPRPAQPNLTELLASAERALQANDPNAALELAKKVLIAQPGFPPAQNVVNRAEALKRDGRIRDVLQQAEKFLALEELTSARGVLATAREVDAASPLVKAFEAKLDAAAAARAAMQERAQRERDQQREQREREQRAREQQEIEQRRIREQQELDERRAREQAELEQRREREQREREQREREEREEREREERARMQREVEAREQEQRDREQRERERREREKKEREQRDREAALRNLAKPLPGEAAPDELTAVTMQLPRDVIRPPMPTPPPVAQATPKAAAPPPPPPPPPPAPVPPSPPAKPVEPPRAAAPPPAAPVTSPPTAKPGGPSRKSKPYTAGPSQTSTPAAPPSTAPPPAVPRPPSAPPPAVPAARPPQATGAPVPAAVVARSGVSPQTLGIVIGVVVLLAAIVGLVLMFQSRGETPPQTPQNQQVANPPAAPPATADPAPTPTAPVTTPPPATPDPGTPPVTTTTDQAPPSDPPPPATMSTVYIDIRPWARVKITSATPNPAIPADTFYVPFAVDLPPGDYNLEAENGGVSRATTFQLKVAPGGAQSFVRAMPGFNATKVVESLLGQE